jgi:DNA-binding response OmpR family regulator
MSVENLQRLEFLASQLVASLMTAAVCVQEMRETVRIELDESNGGSRHRGQTSPTPVPINGQRPLVDESTLSVFWNGRRCHLGHTTTFRLLERLARRPNQYVTHLDLLHDVWDDEELATATIRSTVRHLRRRLRDGDMAELAQSIRGHDGRYILQLN